MGGSARAIPHGGFLSIAAPSADDRDPNFKQQGRDADIYACDLGAHAVCQLDPVRVANWRDIAEQALRNVDPFSACMLFVFPTKTKRQRLEILN